MYTVPKVAFRSLNAYLCDTYRKLIVYAVWSEFMVKYLPSESWSFGVITILIQWKWAWTWWKENSCGVNEQGFVISNAKWPAAWWCLGLYPHQQPTIDRSVSILMDCNQYACLMIVSRCTWICTSVLRHTASQEEVLLVCYVKRRVAIFVEKKTTES